MNLSDIIPNQDYSYEAKLDQHRVEALADIFNAAATPKFPAALLAGIASRESHVGLLLTKDGWGDQGRAFGMMQIDRRAHDPITVDGPMSLAHVQQALSILNNNYQQLWHLYHVVWPDAYLVRGAVAAYNVGVRNIRTLSGMDIGTTHDNYSSDVWSRAIYFRDNITPLLQ